MTHCDLLPVIRSSPKISGSFKKSWEPPRHLNTHLALAASSTVQKGTRLMLIHSRHGCCASRLSLQDPRKREMQKS